MSALLISVADAPVMLLIHSLLQLSATVSEQLSHLEKSADQVLGYALPADAASSSSLSGLEHGGFLVAAPEELTPGPPPPPPGPAAVHYHAGTTSSLPRRVDSDDTAPVAVTPRRSATAEDSASGDPGAPLPLTPVARAAAATPATSDTPAGDTDLDADERGAATAGVGGDSASASVLSPLSLVSASVTSPMHGEATPAPAPQLTTQHAEQDVTQVKQQLAAAHAELAELKSRLAQREAALERAAQSASALVAAEAETSHDDVAQLQAKVRSHDAGLPSR